MSLEDYLQLLDWTARAVTPAKRGSTPASAPSILQRLGLDASSWCELPRDFGKLFRTVAGRPDRVDAMRSPRTHCRVFFVALVAHPQFWPATYSLGNVLSLMIAPNDRLVRLNRQRINEIGGYLVAGMLPSITLGEFQRRFAESGIVLPPCYELRYGGEASKRDDAVGNLLASVGFLMAMMLATLVLSLGSFRLGAIIGSIATMSVGLGLLSIGLGG